MDKLTENNPTPLEQRGIIQFIVLIIIALGILGGIYLVGQRTNLKSKATLDGVNLSLQPAQITAAAGETKSIDIFANTNGKSVSAVELYIRFDPNQVNITAIQPSSLMPLVLKPSSVSGSDASITFGTTSLFTGTGVIATINLQTKPAFNSSTALDFTSQTQVAVSDKSDNGVGTLSSASINSPTSLPSPSPTTAPQVQTLPVYRLVKSSGDHLYTMSESEKASAVSQYGYTLEGVGFYASQEQVNNLVPVYRLNNGNDHFYTTSQSEKDNARSRGYNLEDTAFYGYSEVAANLLPVYRLVNSRGYHFYTTSSSEKDSAISSYGYTYEGVAFYVPQSP